MLPEQKIKNHVEWGIAISRVKNIMLICRHNETPEQLIEATRSMKKAIELSWEFPGTDIRRFLTISTAIALYCHLHCYAYVEFDRQILLRMARRYPRPVFGDILNSVGMLYQEHGKVKEAAQLYKQAIKLLPTNHPRFNLLISNLQSLSQTSVSKE